MRLGCPTQGCTASWASDGYHRAKHIGLPHTACLCGWVGVSMNVHIAQRRRRGFDVTRCGYARSVPPG